ncbi:HPP family protein [Streptomyces sp. NPDC048111]|uniref:HPP family protein n=1 Tax=Streptomyces sp. NPDC048111 TaxID=3365500 RepID=UPI003718269D
MPQPAPHVEPDAARPSTPRVTAVAWRRLSGKAPSRPPAGATFHTVSAAATVLLMLVAIGAVIHEPVLIPPLAASAALVHGAPTLPLSQPRNVVVGHLLGALTGYAVLATVGSSPWATALAGAATIALTLLARAPHSPACATPVVVVLQHPAPQSFLPLLAGACGLLVLGEYAASRIRRNAPKYPAYWW